MIHAAKEKFLRLRVLVFVLH